MDHHLAASQIGHLLLNTKLQTPQVRRDQVPRPRLEQQLDLSLAGRATTVCAEAGSGKTTLVASWVHSLQRDTAWYSLGEEDNDLVRFVTHLSAAVFKSGFLSQAQSDSESYRRSGYAQQIVTRLLNDVALNEEPLVLVFDDYQEIDTQQIHDVVSFMLQHHPANMHLVLLSRKQLPFSLSKLRGRGELTEITEDDLRFTYEEVLAFLNDLMQLDLPPQAVGRLGQKTEGWITGLLLAAHSLRRITSAAERSEFISAFGGDDRNVLDYLFDEIVVRQPDPIREFLLRTSVLRYLCGSLCDQVIETPNPYSQEMLEYLEKEHLFVIALDEKREWYRYHPLFGDALRSLLRRSEQETVPTLHLRASEWYERHGWLQESVEQALAAGDFERTANLIESCTDKDLFRGDMSLVIGWIEALPCDLVTSRPQLCLVEAAALLLTEGSRASVQAERALREVELALLRDAPKLGFPNSAHRSISARATGISALLSPTRGDPPTRSIEMSRRAMTLLSRTDTALLSFVALNLASVYLQVGDDRASERTLGEARNLARQSGNCSAEVLALALAASIDTLRGNLRDAAELCVNGLSEIVEPLHRAGHLLPASGALHIQLGRILLEWNSIDEATSEFRHGIELVELLEDSLRGDAYLALIRLSEAQGDIEEIARLIEKFGQLSPDSASYGSILRRRYALLYPGFERISPAGTEGLASRARELDRSVELVGPGLRRHWRYTRQLAVVRLLLEEHRLLGNADLLPARRYLERQIGVAKERGWRGLVIEMQMLIALVLKEMGERTAAYAALTESLFLASGERFLRLYLDEGPVMLALLAEMPASGAVERQARRVLDCFFGEQVARSTDPKARDAKPSPISGSLSRREIDVLRLLAEGLSNAEIAHRLCVSPNTAKKHTANVYMKLAVRNRVQAVRRAWALNLLH